MIYLSKRQILDSSKVKKLADNNFKFNTNGRKVSKQAENTVGKDKLTLEQFFLSSQGFQKGLYCRHVKTRTCLGKERVNQITRF